MRIWFSITITLCCLFSYARETVHLWDDSGTRAKGVTLTAYKASPQGGKLSPAVIICPGGSYCWLSMKTEGREVAKWLQENGISAFVLKYRVQGFVPYVTHSRLFFKGHQYPDAADDLKRAIEYVREHAEEYGIDPNRIGVMGFSAGGHLSLSLTLSQGEGTMSQPLTSSSGCFTPPSEGTREAPAFIAAIYPVVSMSHPASHKRSRRALLGEYGKRDRNLRDSLSIEKHIPKDCPPVFFVNCKDDKVVKCRNSELLDSALTAQGISHRYIQYATGGHGFGASEKKGTAECRAWKEEFLKWLKETPNPL